MSGALLGFACGIVLTYVSSFWLLFLIVVAVYVVLSYYFVRESEYWYVWQQVGVAFAMVVVTDGPILTHDLVIGRFEGIILGAIVGSLSYLVPLPPIREEKDAASERAKS